jgi:MoaA/NifB/PqqE/SkfB family radical SAM enzyme
MCPWTDIRTPGALMSDETWQHVRPYLSQAENVDLTGGGEPLKHPRLVEFAAQAKAAGCNVGFSSNAVRLKPEVSQALIDAGLDWISFSVDAATPALYEQIRQGARFEQITANIAALRDLKRRLGRGPRLMMVFVVMTGAQQNYHELPAFIHLAHELGVEQVIAKNLDVIIKDGDDQRRVFAHDGSVASEVLAALDEAAVRAADLGLGFRRYNLRPQEVTVCEHNPLGSVFVNWQGLVSPCITLSYAEERVFDGARLHVPCQRFGDINLEPLEAIWSKPEYVQFRAHFERRLAAERHATLDRMLGGTGEALLPPAPEGCQACYYLYGV